MVLVCFVFVLGGVFGSLWPIKFKPAPPPAPAPVAQLHDSSALYTLRRGDIVLIPFRVKTFTPDGKTTICELVKEAK